MKKTRTFLDIPGFSLEKFKIVYRIHAVKRIFERDISLNDIHYCIKNGIIIEQYPDDLPFPSFLVNGYTSRKNHLHIVAAINSDEKILYIITAYIPEPAKWTNDFSERINS